MIHYLVTSPYLLRHVITFYWLKRLTFLSRFLLSNNSLLCGTLQGFKSIQFVFFRFKICKPKHLVCSWQMSCNTSALTTLNINEETNCFVARCEVRHEVRQNDSPLGFHSVPRTFQRSDVFANIKIISCLQRENMGLGFSCQKNGKHILQQKQAQLIDLPRISFFFFPGFFWCHWCSGSYEFRTVHLSWMSLNVARQKLFKCSLYILHPQKCILAKCC